MLPATAAVEAYTARLVELAWRAWHGWPRRMKRRGLARVRFFDVERERIWILWRRVLHSAHHRTQLTVYLRLLERTVPPSYGPTADVSWQGATRR